MGGVESTFQLLAYKVDILQIDVTKDVRSLLYNAVPGPDQVEISVSIRNPMRFRLDNAYVGGLEIGFSLYFSSERVPENRIAQGRAGVSGYFKIVGDPLDPEAERNLVRVQIPTILFPFVRSAATALTVNAGFSALIFPLVNVQELARQAGERIQVVEAGAVEHPAPAP